MQKLKNIYHLIQAIIANLWYGFPSRKLKVIGVTGTDGKTTTTHLIAHILKTSGHKASFVSSVYADIAGKVYDIGFHVTTPSPFTLQKFLKQSLDFGDEYFILETTSHAIDQNRIWGIKYEVAVLTNVTHEHLDYHKNYDEYLKVKTTLLEIAKKSLINEDDESYNYLSQKLKLKSQRYNSKFNGFEKFTQLTKFNQYNYSAGYLVCKQLGLNDDEIFVAMKSFVLPRGRMELVYDKNFKIIIDFAHTPNALANLLPELRNKYLKKNSKLIHVFGAAGLRDMSKRPLMGLVSSQFADKIILTEEDFRTEKPEEICNQIASGIKNNRTYEIIINREQAIFKAINMAKKGDIVVLTGKSHEKSLCRGKVEYPWDEHEAVRKALKL